MGTRPNRLTPKFPHLRVGTFIEADYLLQASLQIIAFPHLRVGTFIEASQVRRWFSSGRGNFPTFGWGLSLRPEKKVIVIYSEENFPTFGWGLSLRQVSTERTGGGLVDISPPSGGDFH